MSIEADYRHQQKLEHDSLDDALDRNGCLNKLAIYLARMPRDQAIDWYAMPQELINCAPRFLTERKKEGG